MRRTRPWAMSDRRCPRVRPSRLARDKEWLVSYTCTFTRFIWIGDSQNQRKPTRATSAYQAQKDMCHAPDRTG